MAETSETAPRNIYQRMAAVMAKVAYIQKDEKQKGMNYRTVSHDAVVALLRPHFLEEGIHMEVDVVEHSQDGNRTEATVLVSFVNIDEPKDRILAKAFGYGVDQQDKGPGKAISYAVKYALLKNLFLETGDDPDYHDVDHEPEAEHPPPPPPEPEDPGVVKRKEIMRRLYKRAQAVGLKAPELWAALALKTGAKTPAGLKHASLDILEALDDNPTPWLDELVAAAAKADGEAF